MSNDKKEDLKIDKKLGIFWVLLIIILVIGGQIAFLIALSML